MRAAASVAALSARSIREIGDWVPRGAAVALLDGDDALTRIVVREKGCTLEVPRQATVLIALTEATLRDAAFVEALPHASMAIVVAARRDLVFLPAGWHVVDEKPLAPLDSTLFRLPMMRQLAETSRRWKGEPLPPVRWFYYRVHRMLSSTARLERLALQALAGRKGARDDLRRLVLLARST